MKKLGKAAIILAAVFLVTAIVGGICIFTGLRRSDAVGQFVSRITQIISNFMIDLDTGVSDAVIYIPLDENVTTITLENISGNIDVKTCSGSDIKVSISGMPDGVELESDASGSDVTIRFAGEIRASVFFNGRPCEITVLVPEGYNGALRFTSIAGSVNVSDLTLSELEISKSAGEYDFINVTADLLDLKLLTGDIDFTGCLGSFTISDLVGDIDIETRTVLTEDCDVSNIIGDIDITVPGDSVIALDKTNSMGEFEVDSSVSGNGGITIDVFNCKGDIEVDAE